MKIKQKTIVIMLAMLALWLCIIGLSLSTPSVASAQAAAQAAQAAQASQTMQAAPVIDWGALLTQAVVWIIGMLAGIAAWFLKKYIYPWVLTVAVPWLQTHNLIAVAEMAVKYAEAELGRHAGDEKWKLAITLLQAKGFDVNRVEVAAALMAAWETLNLQQIAAGVKDAAEHGEA